MLIAFLTVTKPNQKKRSGDTSSNAADNAEQEKLLLTGSSINDLDSKQK